MLREESTNVDTAGKPIHHSVEDLGAGKYAASMRLLSGWIDGNLDLYKVSHTLHCSMDTI